MDPIHSPLGFELTFVLPDGEFDTIPASVCQPVRESILRHVHNGTQICLVTSSNRSGKSRFVKQLCRTLSKDVRTIQLSSHDFSDSYQNDIAYEIEPETSDHFAMIKHCIADSATLDEKLVVIIDDADFLPLETIEELLATAMAIPATAKKVCFIFLGHPNLASLLDQTSSAKNASVALLSLDKLTSKDLQDYINYCQLPCPTEQRISLHKDAIEEIVTQSSGSLYKASVILEWSLRYCRDQQDMLLQCDDIHNVVQHISQLSAKYNKNYFLAYPPLETEFLNDTSSDTTTATLRESEPSIQYKRPVFTLDDTIVNPAPNPPILENVVALKESSRIKPNNVQRILRTTKPSRAEKSNHLRVPDTNRSYAKLLLLIPLVGILLFFVKDLGFVTSDRNPTLTTSEHNNTPSIMQQPVASGADIAQKEDDVDKMRSSVPATAVVGTALDEIVESADASLPIESNPTADVIMTPVTQLADKLEAGLSIDNFEANGKANRDATTDEILQRLLIMAQTQFAQKKLTTPAEDSAFSTYQIILHLDPGNVRAIDGINRITDQYVSWAENSIARGDLASAKRYYQRALRVAPNDFEITARLKSLER